MNVQYIFFIKHFNIIQHKLRGDTKSETCMFLNDREQVHLIHIEWLQKNYV